MAKQQKFFSLTPVAAALLAVSTTTFSIDADAALQFLREVKGPVTVTGTGADKSYSFYIQMRIINDDLIPETGDAPAAVPIQVTDAIKDADSFASIKETMSIEGLETLPDAVGCESKCAETADTPPRKVGYNTARPAVNGAFSGTGAGAAIFPTGTTLAPYSAVTVRYKVTITPGADLGPYVSTASLNGTQDDDAKFFIPAAPKARVSVCPEGTVPNSINIVNNGGFDERHGPLAKDKDGKTIPLAPGTEIAKAFSSDFNFVGDNAYPPYKAISLVTEIPKTETTPGVSAIFVTEGNHFQYPFPGALKDGDIPAVDPAKGYLLGAGQGVDGPVIWKQKITGFDPEAFYQFEAWVSNPAPPDIDGDDAIIKLTAGTTTSEEVTLVEETNNDAWTQISVRVAPTGTELDLSISNGNVAEGNFNLFAVTGIGFLKCVDPNDKGKEAGGASTSGGTSTTGGTTTGGGATTGGTTTTGGTSTEGTTSGGGGGGALGLALGLFGIAGLRRRR